MAGNQIPISYVVSASTVLPQAGLEPLKMSTILLITDDETQEEFANDYLIARSPKSVVNAFGTDALTTQMANSIFAQNPNILTNDGYLIVAPYKNAPATVTTVTTTNISANISNFASVTDGSLTYVVDGDTYEATNLNFEGVTNLRGIVDVLNSEMGDYLNISTNGETIVFSALNTGDGTSIEFTTSEAGTDLYGATYLNGEDVETVLGQNEQPETYSQAISRLAGKLYFNGILTTRFTSNAELVEASNTVQALVPERILFAESNSMDSILADGLFSQIYTNYFTKCLLYTYGEDSDNNAKLFASAYASRLFSVNYSGSNTTITMNLKDLVGIQADTNISETVLAQASAYGVDVFASVEGLPKVLSNKAGSYFIDQVQNSIWFKNAVQRAVFNTLGQTRTKIPQTEAGMQILINAISDVEKQAVANGYCAPGKWNSPDTFGVLEDFHRNVEDNGYYNYHLPIRLQQQAEREQRKAPLVQIAIKEAGAVHSAGVIIYVES